MAAWDNDPVVATEAPPQAAPWEHDPVAEPPHQPTAQPTFAAGSPREIAHEQLTAQPVVQQQLERVGRAVGQTAVGLVKGLPQMAKFIKPPSLVDVLGGAAETVDQMKQAVNAPVGSQDWWNAIVPLGAQAAMEVGGVRAASPGLHESLFGEKPPVQHLEAETAAAKEVINNATQEGIIQEDNIVQHPGDGEGGTPAETGGSGGVEPSPKAPQEKVATAPEAFPSLLQSSRRAELRQEPSPVSEPTETTTAQPLTQKEGGEVGEKVQVQKEGQGREGVLTPEAATVQTPAAPTGISNERLKEIYGDDAIIAGKGRGPQEWQRIGQADTRDPYAVLSKAKERGIAPPEDVALLRAEHQRLANAAREAYGTERYNELAQNATDMANSIKGVAHGPASDVMRALQDVDIPKYDSPADFDRIVRERMNRESTPEEKSTFEKVTQEVRNGDSEVKSTASEAQNRLARYRPKETISFEDAIKHVKDQITELTTNCNL